MARSSFQLGQNPLQHLEVVSTARVISMFIHMNLKRKKSSGSLRGLVYAPVLL